MRLSLSSDIARISLSGALTGLRTSLFLARAEGAGAGLGAGGVTTFVAGESPRFLRKLCMKSDSFGFVDPHFDEKVPGKPLEG